MKDDVLVIGGGIIGLCAARELQMAGARVALLDRAPVGTGCSFANAGWLTPCFAMPLPQSLTVAAEFEAAGGRILPAAEVYDFSVERGSIAAVTTTRGRLRPASSCCPRDPGRQRSRAGCICGCQSWGARAIR